MPSVVPGGNPANRTWVYARAEHLLELREFVEKHPLTPTNRIVAWAETLLQKEAQMMRLLEEKGRKKRRRTEEGGGERLDNPTDEPGGESVSVPEPVTEAPNPETSVLVIPRRTIEGFSMGDLLRSSPVAESKIIRSTSSKLDYILTEVRRPCSIHSTTLNPDGSFPGAGTFERRKNSDILELPAHVGDDR